MKIKQLKTKVKPDELIVLIINTIFGLILRKVDLTVNQSKLQTVFEN